MNPFDELEAAVKYCGAYALDKQDSIGRGRKKDGTVITETDLFIDSCLKEKLEELFPSSTLISEESVTRNAGSSDKDSYIFILDPIDGTDVYSQGLPTWCIALGILNRSLEPVGSVIYAPRWGIGRKEGLFIRLDPEGATEKYEHVPHPLPLPERSLRQLVVGSRVYRHLDMRKFKGKCRNFGSTILHLIAPVVNHQIDGAISHNAYVWDLAAAHPILLTHGLTLTDRFGEPFTYTHDFLTGKARAGLLFAGSAAHCRELADLFADSYCSRQTT